MPLRYSQTHFDHSDVSKNMTSTHCIQKKIWMSRSMETAAIRSRARNWIAQISGSNISRIRLEKLTSTVWANNSAGSKRCHKNHKEDPEEELKTTIH